ncbi:Uncharacterized protein, contains FMN-binding domain [Friedmanniella luteola]|uniref:Uncharacterized protein, contains FMN-binding domain n=1 Tax=Friedmanniella luteola TaxID=546871 RepID=A0A1H1RD56_9ACTN|nr:FMN-binding protein [Friedmanniella luteola]SDS33661.1 Uncharacterized protein, contains FMN-binding domain [Friedmanniella luteola]
MRRIVLWLASTVTVVVLLFSYHTSTDSAATAPASTASSRPTSSAAAGSGSGTGGSGSGGSPVPTPTASPTPSPSSTASSAGQASGTYTGTVAQTRWGPVQVQITTAAGKVTAVDVVEYPTENPRDQEINARAVPELVRETIDAQSADIDMVSGATVTSEGYLQSLQSALDQAGI